MGEQNEGHISLFKKGYEAQNFTQDSNQQRQLQFEVNRQPTSQLDHNQLEFLKGVTAALSNLHRVPYGAQLPQPRPLLSSQQGQPSLETTQQLNNLLANYPNLHKGEGLGQHVGGMGMGMGMGMSSGGGGNMQMGDDGLVEDSSSGPRTDYNDADDGTTGKKRRARTPQQQERNKLAQQRYRERCKTKHKEMEQALNKYNNRINKLENENKYFRESDHTLRRQIQELRSENLRLKNMSSQPQESFQQINPITSSPPFVFQQPPSSSPQTSDQITLPQPQQNNITNTNLAVYDHEEHEDALHQLLQIMQSAETIQMGIQNIVGRRVKRKLSQELEGGQGQGQDEGYGLEFGLSKIQRLLGQHDVHCSGLQQHQEEELLMRSRDLGVEQQTRDLLQRYQSFFNKELPRSCQIGEYLKCTQGAGDLRGEGQRCQNIEEGTQLVGGVQEQQKENQEQGLGQVSAQQETCQHQEEEVAAVTDQGQSPQQQNETAGDKEDEGPEITLQSLFQHLSQEKGEVSNEQFSEGCKSKLDSFIPDFLQADPLNLSFNQKMENLEKTILMLLKLFDVGNEQSIINKFVKQFMEEIKEKHHFLHEYIYSETRRLIKDFYDKIEKNSASIDDLLKVAQGIVFAVHVKQED